jgi:2-keto-4-pentenoate hydratase/2-oxohepta-3-ene-1,7-dioic acid hydratase in catechol pathway
MIRIRLFRANALDSIFQRINLEGAGTAFTMKIEIGNDFRPSKIVCVGRNYADHAAELGNEVPEEPLLF